MQRTSTTIQSQSDKNFEIQSRELLKRDQLTRLTHKSNFERLSLKQKNVIVVGSIGYVHCCQVFISTTHRVAFGRV